SDRQAYDNALATLKEGSYEEAAEQFKTFLDHYPQSSYADNSQYWLGEVYYVTRKFPMALKEFEKVIAFFPDSSKIADARLKLGFINYELKNWVAARAELEQVVREFPSSTPARLAADRLARMEKEGH
ncbi:MAG: tol-pal system protein YbgF, partial [Gammaproteobacteria bacterium]